MASQIMSTVILAGTIIAISLSVSFFATSILMTRMQEQEYENAKNMMLQIGDKIENVASAAPASNSELEWFDRTSGRLNFLARSISVAVSVTGTNTNILNGQTGSLEFQAGPLVGTVARDIFGNDSIVVQDLSTPLTRIYEYQSNGARIELDYARVRVVDKGCFWFNDEGPSSGHKAGYLNVLRIAFINITIGRTSGPNRIHVLIRNIGTLELQSVIGNNHPIITVVIGGEIATFAYNGLDAVNGVSVDGTIVQVLRSDIEITSW